ncbi:unknown [[Mannheimia] succiniciproducens MBEL55E]|uniref:Uncharacterized protein n=1 Tax=Mannheimia succiniciproducens (strain KCTC 0769BP / MBEL55E) TaxID=221988 RepID=Q65S16_MANSM|nr:unknown [[Mannheimia] succiniciproducens MBEL55E]
MEARRRLGYDGNRVIHEYANKNLYRWRINARSLSYCL